jgi:hypothetical protein
MRFWFIAGRNGKQFPQYWKNDPEEGKNLYEAEFLTAQLKRLD